MKTYFVTFSPITWASARFRAHWVTPYLPGSKVVDFRDIPRDGDVYIWNKFAQPYAIDTMRTARHYWDVCDPFWWFRPGEAQEIIGKGVRVVASNDALAEDFSDWSGDECIVIPDRLEMSHYPMKHQHGKRDEVKFIWFGHQANRQAIISALVYLERLAANGHKISLTILDGAPDTKFNYTEMFPVYHLPWTLEDENSVIASYDIALLPPYPGPWGRVKSNNKQLTAWACGLPVTDGQDYNGLLGLVTDCDWRAALAAEGEDHLKADGLVEKSGRQWHDLLSLS